MPVRPVAVTFDVQSPERAAEFWAALLERDIDETHGVRVTGDETHVGLGFVHTSTAKDGPNPVHLHRTSHNLADQQRTVERAMGLGGRALDLGQRPEEGHVVLTDPEGNEFCVIEPDNAYLAGCGFLAEVTCEGTPDVGRFWRDALGWEMVWDRGKQTAIQPPAGGMKISWDVRPGPPRYGTRGQRLEVACTDLDADVARLVALGATERGRRDGRLVMADPDGGEFSVIPG